MADAVTPHSHDWPANRLSSSTFGRNAAGVENIAVGVIYVRGFVERVERPQDRIFGKEVEQVFNPRIQLEVFRQLLGELDVHDAIPGGLRGAEMVGHHGQIHGAVDAPRPVDDETYFAEVIGNYKCFDDVTIKYFSLKFNAHITVITASP